MSSSTVNTTTLRRIVRAGTASSFGSRPGMRRHLWTELELQELSIAYLEHRNQMPIWKIAQMLEFSFASPKPVHQEDDDDAPITPKTPKTPSASATRIHVPSVQAITSKLMDCVFLETRGHLGYKNVFPSQLHCQVWEHVKLSQRHREMIQAMKMSTEAAAKTAAASKKQKSFRTLNVHAREFLYDTVEEYEAAFPPAKRRKIINDNDDDNDNDDKPATAAPPPPTSQAPEQSQGDVFAMSEMCEALDEIAHQIEEREQAHQRNNQAIQDSLANIHNHEYQIAMLLTTIHDATAQIETHRQAIAKEMATIEASFAASFAASSAATVTAATSAATAAHTPSLGPLTHAANSSFDPNNYQCRQCSQLFDPRNGGFWLIGPNRETGDTFYLCRECTRFMEETTTPVAAVTEANPRPFLSQNNGEYSDDNCDGDCDCWDSEDDETYYGHGYGYDHSEECS
jgi:hypothetical protein